MCMVQVFPLLMQKFSSKEQGSLVWQFICSVPIMLIEDIFPWMISFLSPEEQVDVTRCIKEIVPREKSLQEVDSQLNSHLNLVQLTECDWFKYVCEGGVFLAWKQ
jgi:zinc finger-like protein